MAINWGDDDSYEHTDNNPSPERKPEDKPSADSKHLDSFRDFFRNLLDGSKNKAPFSLHDFKVALPLEFESDEEKIIAQYKGDLDFLVRDPEYGDLYKDVILNRNVRALERKTRRQIEQMKQLYFSDTRRGDSGCKRRAAKLERFRDFTKLLRPVHFANNYYPRYQSPFSLGRLHNVSSINKLTFEQNYVYASFSKLGYSGASGGQEKTSPVRTFTEGHGQKSLDEVELDEVLEKYASPVEKMALARNHYIDEAGLQKRTEVAMMDLHELRYTADKVVQPSIKLFLDNLFDYKGSKEILALYLAIMFDTAEEAEKFLKENVGPEKAERFYPKPKDSNVVHIGDTGPDRVSDKYPKIKEIFDSLGIVPPLNLEIRIRGYADVAEPSKYFNPRLVEELRRLGIIIPEDRIRKSS